MNQVPPTQRWRGSQRHHIVIAWICILSILFFYAWNVAVIGIDLRNDFWVYWQNNRFSQDQQSALENGRHVLREATALERADQRTLSDFQAELAARETARGNPPATLAQPGPRLFDSPRDLTSIWSRWKKLKPVYVHLFRGWAITYDHLIRDEHGGDYVMDYPPMRSLVITLWAWKVEAEHPGLIAFPSKPSLIFNPFTRKLQPVNADIIRPLLICNGIAEGISAIAMVFLVWIWSRRENVIVPVEGGWRSRWGDPMLLAPPILLGLFVLLRSYVQFEWTDIFAGPSPIDLRITSISWWIFLLLRYTSIVALARFLPRPFRGVACGLVAATMVWINPPSILDSFGWPQWESWLIPFFLVAAVLVSLDWWLTAGIVLAVGGMFKGQLFFIAPVLILCPLFAGWLNRFVRILTGLATGAGVVVWPWLVYNPRAHAYLTASMFAGTLMCIVSIFRRQIWSHIKRRGKAEMPTARWSDTHWLIWTAVTLATITAAVLSLLICRQQEPAYRKFTILLMLAILLVPWFLPRRSIVVWLTLLFACSTWLAGFSLNGSFAWWKVGFAYGTQKHQNMQLGGDSLSNLSSILEKRYNWSLHDSVGTMRIGAQTISLDTQSSLAILFAAGLLLCSIGMAIHLRRNDNKFLMALTAPSVLFVSLLTQMAARYTIFPAVIAAALIGVSFSTTLFQLLMVVISCAMLGDQMLTRDPSTAPILFSITRLTHPDLGWLMLLLAAVFLVGAMTPSKRVNLSNRCLPRG